MIIKFAKLRYFSVNPFQEYNNLGDLEKTLDVLGKELTTFNALDWENFRDRLIEFFQAQKPPDNSSQETEN